jgi:hypothetical protein
MLERKMNVVMLDPPVPEALRQRLAALPQFDPPPTLRARVAVAWAAPRRARALAPWLAAAAVLVVALAFGWTQQARPPQVAADPAARMAGLEREVMALRASRAPAAAAAALESELQRVDRALQAAYDGDAPARQIEALWADREALLDGLLLAYRQPDRMIRI